MPTKKSKACAKVPKSPDDPFGIDSQIDTIRHQGSMIVFPDVFNAWEEKEMTAPEKTDRCTFLNRPEKSHVQFRKNGAKFLIGQYANGNASISIYSDGTKVRVINGSEFKPAFAENIDVKLTNKCAGTNCAYCHEGSGPNGESIDAIPGFMFGLHEYQEVALGGGNILSMDQKVLSSILYCLADKNVIANATVNQFHFMRMRKLINFYAQSMLLRGIGISLVEPTNDFIYEARRTPNAVIHVIAGIVTKEQIEALEDRDLKILILGYKRLRRGSDYYDENSEKINSNIKWLSDSIMDLKDHFDVVSFDNLAIEQLGIKRKIDEKTWDSRYMGDDGTSTFFIDCVEKKFAKSSTEPVESRRSAYSKDQCCSKPYWYSLSYPKDSIPKCDLHWMSAYHMFDVVRGLDKEPSKDSVFDETER